MRFTTEESEEGLSGRAGGEEDELEVVVGGFAIEAEDVPVAAPFALSQGLGGDAAAMLMVTGFCKSAEYADCALRVVFVCTWRCSPCTLFTETFSASWL